ncbi:MAG: hypothetical protein HQL13_04585 [Candidatus Omnitrophica bacterium]|nr:hypothetical protein [Candidatus Omnitrophota bacterium]
MYARRGQTIVEYTIIVIIIIAVSITMKNYFKRGLQGRWKASVDDLGEQYDPGHVTSNIQYSTQVNATSSVTAVSATTDEHTGLVTSRSDLSNSVETKTGYTHIGE